MPAPLQVLDWSMIVLVLVTLGTAFYLLRKASNGMSIMVICVCAMLIIAWPMMLIVYISIPKFF
jgi:hypothetical protein